MRNKYNPSEIESKWQKRWEEKGIYQSKDKVKGKKNYYCLVMFPYASGDLHIGHWYNFAPADVFARFQRMTGRNVLHPIGFDAFGLPAEGAAIKRKIHPSVWTKKNIKKMTSQLKSIGAVYDWSRMVDTSDPSYYQWTQWMFLQMFKNGLAYKKKATANWCPKCQSILANEQAEGGKCWRCEGPVEQRQIEQWFFRITEYADELLSSLKDLDWPQKTLTMQKNWIGRSEGTTIKFSIFNFQFSKQKNFIEVFTTRPDTVFGTTFFCLAPEHPGVAALLSGHSELDSESKRLKLIQYKKSIRFKEIKRYVEKAKKKTELERIAEIKQKTGVFTGAYVKNPLSGKKIPIFIADFVLMSYGTGAVMGVPAHDQRDWEFAIKHKLPIIEVISGGDIKKGAFLGEGKLVNSGKFNGQSSKEAIKNISKYIEEHKIGKRATQYHLRDWLVSRQRYWGAPIPMIYCPVCARQAVSFRKVRPFLEMPGWFPVPEADLPVLLPKIKNFTPKEGESPLARDEAWVKAICPQCGAEARRETDTMDTFVCSSWYYLRYADPDNQEKFASSDKLKTWLPVNMYIGGAEHTVLHLLYSRFFTKALRDFGYLDFDEPFSSLRHQGVILGEDGFKMSKSRGNVINPDDLVKKHGADVVRIYLCFMGPYDQGGPWNSKGILGVERFLNRVWQLTLSIANGHPRAQLGTGSELSPPRHPELHPEDDGPLAYVSGSVSKKEKYWLHKTIKKVGEDIASFNFNTAISSLMEYVNFLYSKKVASSESIKTLVLLLAPFAPHITEELWQQLKDARHPELVSGSAAGQGSAASYAAGCLRHRATKTPWSVHQQPWPKYNSAFIQEEMVTLVIEVDGRVRDKIKLKAKSSKLKAGAVNLAKQSLKIKKHLMGKKVKKTIFIPGKLINFVTSAVTS